MRRFNETTTTLSQCRLSLILWALMVFRERRCKLMMFLSFLWNRSLYLELCGHFALWSSMTSACRVVPRRLQKSAVAVSGFSRRWLFFLRKWRCECFPLNSLGFLCCSWSLQGFCIAVCQAVYSTQGAATEVSGGQIVSLRTAFMSVLDPVVGLSTEVKQRDNDVWQVYKFNALNTLLTSHLCLIWGP